MRNIVDKDLCSMNAQFKKGIVEMCVLSLVASKDRYGYEVVEILSKEIDVSESTIYPILRRLVNENLFTSYLQESKEGPARKYYRISSAGMKFIQQMKSDWEQFVTDVNSILSGEK
jgi:PadR family transcriptional regulator, regulatory protein PadR